MLISGDQEKPTKQASLLLQYDLIAWSTVLLATLAGIAWLRTRHAAEIQALSGYDLLGLMHPVWELPQFARDFPNGEAEIMNSLASQLMRFAGRVGLPDALTQWTTIFAEAGFLATGAWVLARTIWPSAPSWQHAATAVLLVSGNIAYNDLGRWFHPYYGATYNFANGLGLMAVAAMVERRAVLAGLAVGVAFLFHPIIALFFSITIAVIGLLRLREFGFAKFLAGGAMALAIAGIWTFMVLPSGSFATNGAIDAQSYIQLTRLMSSHWYPFTLGVFGNRAWETLLPALALLMLAVIYATGPQRSRRTDEIAIAMAIVFAVSLMGAVLAEYSGIVMIVKIAPHRASAIALLLAAVLVVPRLFDDLFAASQPRALLAGVLIVIVFWLNHGLPLFGTLALAALITAAERRGKTGCATRLRLSAMLGTVAVFILLLLTSNLWPFVFPNLIGISVFRFPLVLLTLALLAIAWFIRRPAVAALAIAISIFGWAPRVDPIIDPPELERAHQYRDVQDWARKNTQPDSIFMTDPAQSYGWRHFSQRPSFGTMREWLYSSWIYNTRQELMDEGLRRAEAVGVTRDDIFPKVASPINNGYAALSAKLTANFHAASPAMLSQLHEKFGVAYFVFDRTKLSSSVEALGPVYQNARYVVVPAPGT